MNKTVYHNDVPPHFIFQKYKNIDPLFKTVLILKVKTSENCEPEWSFFSAGLFEMISPHSNEMQASQPNSTPRLTHSVQEKVSRKRVSLVSNLMTSVLFFCFPSEEKVLSRWHDLISMCINLEYEVTSTSGVMKFRHVDQTSSVSLIRRF